MKSLGNIRRKFVLWNNHDAKLYLQFKNIANSFGSFAAVNNL